MLNLNLHQVYRDTLQKPFLVDSYAYAIGHLNPPSDQRLSGGEKTTNDARRITKGLGSGACQSM